MMPSASTLRCNTATTDRRYDTASLVSTAWVRLTVGKVLYVALQTALLGGCLAAVGADVDPAVVFGAYAVQQVLSLASITPGKVCSWSVTGRR